MKIKFWGTRGSLPIALTAADMRAKIYSALEGAAGEDLSTPENINNYINQLNFSVSGTYGGNTSCIEVDVDSDERFILDLGSGARPLGGNMLKQYGSKLQTYHVFLSHVHWDHIMGFPFFTPAYIPGNRIIIHGCHERMEEAFMRQQSAPCFPVDFKQLGATIEFDLMQPGTVYEFGKLRVRAMRQVHSDDSYGWRLEHNGRCVVYSTDSEHKLDIVEDRLRFTEFFADADLVIFDAMYSLADAATVRADWGHSSNIVGVELCQLARVRRLCLFHHEPSSDDARISRVLTETRRYEEITRDTDPLEIVSAYDGLELAV